MTQQNDSLMADVVAIEKIEAVPTILDVVCRTTGMGFAAVARVTDTRWIACSVLDKMSFGLPAGGELDLATTICNEIRDSRQMVVIDHVSADPIFHGHHTAMRYGFESYISIPIYRRSGEFFGTLCAIHPEPRTLNVPEVTGMFQLFADLIGFHLDANERVASSERALMSERESAELREQFIAVLGHDLRNPLASISAGSGLMRKLTQDDKLRAILTRMDKSILRIARLIDNVTDFARGRLGGGLTLSRRPDGRLRADLEQVVAELQAAWPERRIETQIDMDRIVDCDSGRMAQLLSNLLANAITHGDMTAPIQVDIATRDDTFELTVSNQGVPIPPQVKDQLFQPFFRGPDPQRRQGLGLGLFIASEIARAHGGSLSVHSDRTLTRFHFQMPLL